MRNALAIVFVFIAGIGAGLLAIGILTRYSDAMCREPLDFYNGFIIGGAVIVILFFARKMWRTNS
jgi:hypothetical protein